MYDINKMISSTWTCMFCNYRFDSCYFFSFFWGGEGGGYSFEMGYVPPPFYCPLLLLALIFKRHLAKITCPGHYRYTNVVDIHLRIGEKMCNCSCSEIDQKMDAILLIIGIAYGACRIVIKSVQQCTYFLFSVNLLLVGVNYGQRTMQVCS